MQQSTGSSQQEAVSRKQSRTNSSLLTAHCLLLTLILFLLALPVASWGQQTHTFTLTWSWEQGEGAAATGFILERRTLPAGSWLEVSRPAASARSATERKLRK